MTTEPVEKLWNLSFLFSQKGQQMLARVDPDGSLLDVQGNAERKAELKREEEEREFARRMDEYQHELRRQQQQFQEELDRDAKEATAQRDAYAKEIREMDEAAPKLNGEAVYRTRDHRHAFTARGRELSRPEFESVPWNTLKNERYYDDRQNRKEAMESAQQRIDHIDKIEKQANSGSATLEDLQKLRAEAARVKAANAASANELSSRSLSLSRSGLSAPSLETPFAAAAEGISINTADPKPPVNPGPVPTQQAF